MLVNVCHQYISSVTVQHFTLHTLVFYTAFSILYSSFTFWIETKQYLYFILIVCHYLSLTVSWYVGYNKWKLWLTQLARSISTKLIVSWTHPWRFLPCSAQIRQRRRLFLTFLTGDSMCTHSVSMEPHAHVPDADWDSATWWLER